MTMITPSYLGETIEYSSLHACRSTLEDPTRLGRQNETSSRDSFARSVEVEDRIDGRAFRQRPTEIDRSNCFGVSGGVTSIQPVTAR